MKHHNKYLQPVEAEIDLHQLTREETKSALVDFLEEAKEKKYRRVRIITGKGLHSVDGKGVLKEYVASILEREGLKYRDAKLYEGGEGAIEAEMF